MRRTIVIGHHLIFSSYGFWLANDPRGSGSTEIRQHKFEELGPIHPGRKREQPTRAVLRAFYEAATPRLEFAPLWFDEAIRSVIANSFERTLKRYRYTAWAFAILANHAHLCVRQHRDKYEVIWERFALDSREAVLALGRISPMHRVWAERPYSVYQYSPDDVWRTVRYIEGNPVKEGLPAQRYSWVVPYDNWPLHRKM
jgi:hypothetical protein